MIARLPPDAPVRGEMLERTRQALTSVVVEGRASSVRRAAAGRLAKLDPAGAVGLLEPLIAPMDRVDPNLAIAFRAARRLARALVAGEAIPPDLDPDRPDRPIAPHHRPVTLVPAETPSPGEVRLAWTTSAQDRFVITARFDVERRALRSDGTLDPDQAWERIGTTSELALVDRSARAGRRYAYRVRSFALVDPDHPQVRSWGPVLAAADQEKVSSPIEVTLPPAFRLELIRAGEGDADAWAEVAVSLWRAEGGWAAPAIERLTRDAPLRIATRPARQLALGRVEVRRAPVDGAETIGRGVWMQTRTFHAELRDGDGDVLKLDANDRWIGEWFLAAQGDPVPIGYLALSAGSGDDAYDAELIGRLGRGALVFRDAGVTIDRADGALPIESDDREVARLTLGADGNLLLRPSSAGNLMIEVHASSKRGAGAWTGRRREDYVESVEVLRKIAEMQLSPLGPDAIDRLGGILIAGESPIATELLELPARTALGDGVRGTAQRALVLALLQRPEDAAVVGAVARLIPAEPDAARRRAAVEALARAHLAAPSDVSRAALAAVEETDVVEELREIARSALARARESSGR